MRVCKFCCSDHVVKNGKPKGVQRYLCKDCTREQITGDNRQVYDNPIKKAAVVLYLEGNGFRGIARCLSMIFDKNISFQIVSHWINSAGKIVEQDVAQRKLVPSVESKKVLPVVEMDELYTYVKKNLVRIKKREPGKAITPAYGLLLIGTQAICLSLK